MHRRHTYLTGLFLLLAAALPAQQQGVLAPTPPMGWNSWDCFGAGVVEDEVLANAEYMNKNLKKHGWNIITIDIQWYEPLAHTDQYRRSVRSSTTAFANAGVAGRALRYLINGIA